MNHKFFWWGYWSFRHCTGLAAVFWVVCVASLMGCTPRSDVAPGSTSMSAAAVEETVSSARQAFNVGAFDKAYSGFSAVLRLEPDNTTALLGRGASSLSLGQPDAAMGDFARVLQHDENNADAFYNLGLALFQLGRTEKAETAFSKAIQCNPGFAKAYNNRGLSRVRLNRPDEATADFTRSFELQNEKALEPIYNRAALYQSQKVYEKALADYLVAESLRPYSVRVKNNLGVVYIELGRLDKAMAVLDEAISIRPDDPDVRFNRAILYEKKNDYKKAIADYNNALIQNPKMADGYLNRGILYMRLHNTAEGCGDIRQACELGACELYENLKSKNLCD